jgi:hypothetical protein
MNRDQRIRVVKKGERAYGAGAPAAAEKAPTERELKRTVAGWVSEHRQRSEELSRGLAGLFGLEPRPQIF